MSVHLYTWKSETIRTKKIAIEWLRDNIKNCLF